MLRAHIAITVIVAAALGFSFWQHPIACWGVRQMIGLVLLVVGFILWTVARFQLGASFAVSAQARQLVTRGLYSRIRNPIYVFGSCFVAGAILLFGRPLWLAIFLVLVPLQIWRSRKEERILESAFGEQYRAYRAATWF
jgi:protein-S-isoprenylcysteine O-methyltransferase Ste14